MKRKREEEKVGSEIRSAIEELSTLAKLKPKNDHNPGAAQIPTVPFLSICDLVIQVLDKIGPTMTVLRKDIHQNIQRLEKVLESDPSLYSNAVEILKKEESEGNSRMRTSCSRAFVWLTRSLDFTVALLQNLTKDFGQNNMEKAVEESYNITLKSWHGPSTEFRNPESMVQSLKAQNFASNLNGIHLGDFVLSVYEGHYKMMNNYQNFKANSENYPFPNLRNLVMVAGHSVYTSSSCGKVDKEDSWFLESYQKNPGQASTFLAHIQEGIDIAAKDEAALLLFSGGETRKDAGPRSEAQSYWAVAEAKEWFGKGENVRSRALTEEHARDSFENLLFSVCRFRELTGTYPQNISVVSYDFKEERFAQLHRSALGFPESRFSYSGTPAISSAKAAAQKGEALVRTQFKEDPYGCQGSLYRKKLGRDPFHRTIPYPNGCPEIEGLFRYCGTAPYPGYLPWAQ
ncbi:Uncharacterized protein L484_003538 [Morus notabilis]|uniref:Glycolipid transfer protein domain-containing protein n=1 Tax=Morus notabilis TaxID=981085 RepID=W9SU28_9ROSA|nr:Uncharacterized protein L484_003538 [Morus notabilis]